MLRTTLAWLDCVEIVRIRDQLCEENRWLPLAFISWILVYFRLRRTKFFNDAESSMGCIRTLECALILFESRWFDLKMINEVILMVWHETRNYRKVIELSVLTSRSIEQLEIEYVSGRRPYLQLITFGDICSDS